MTDEPCSQCGQPAVRTLCAYAYCTPCADAILDPIRERIAAQEVVHEPGIGIGIQHGPLRPDWGPNHADLQCDVCEATWTGPIGETCAYCLRWLELAQETQRKVLLWPDLPDMGDERYIPALQGWAKRLAAAVAEEIITERQARHAWDRQVPDVAS